MTFTLLSANIDILSIHQSFHWRFIYQRCYVVNSSYNQNLRFGMLTVVHYEVNEGGCTAYEGP